MPDLVWFRVYVGGKLVDEAAIDFAMPDAAGELAVVARWQGDLAADAIRRGLLYLVEVEYPDGDHVRFGTDHAGMVDAYGPFPLDRIAEELAKRFAT